MAELTHNGVLGTLLTTPFTPLYVCSHLQKPIKHKYYVYDIIFYLETQ